MTVFYLDAKLSSFQYISVNGAALLSMYKYILFKSFGEDFILNTISVIKENSDGTFLAFSFCINSPSYFSSVFSSFMKYFISERSIVCPSTRALFILTRAVRRHSLSIFSNLAFSTVAL